MKPGGAFKLGSLFAPPHHVADVVIQRVLGDARHEQRIAPGVHASADADAAPAAAL